MVWRESVGENGVDYIQLSLFFESAMFFAGITASSWPVASFR